MEHEKVWVILVMGIHHVWQSPLPSQLCLAYLARCSWWCLGAIRFAPSGPERCWGPGDKCGCILHEAAIAAMLYFGVSSPTLTLCNCSHAYRSTHADRCNASTYITLPCFTHIIHVSHVQRAWMMYLVSYILLLYTHIIILPLYGEHGFIVAGGGVWGGIINTHLLIPDRELWKR